MKNKQGISLIVLIVTIIVIIILAAAVILTLNNNNPIDSSRIAQLADSRANVNSAINLYYGKKMAETQGQYDTQTILLYGDNVGNPELVAAGTKDANTAIGVGTTIATKYYEINTKSLDGMKLPEMTGAKWYVDSQSGLVYLVYENVANVPSWMYKDATNLDTTLAEFVMVVSGDGNTLIPANKGA